MISGRDALGLIQRAIEEEKARTTELDARLEASSQGLLAIDQRRAGLVRDLARVWVGAVAEAAGAADAGASRAGAALARLEQAERGVRAALGRRGEAAVALERSLRELEARLAERRAERDALAEAFERADDALDEAEAATQARLASEPDYVALRDAARASERTAVHADEKATVAEREREAKGAAYDADPLFTYLWRRGYGTPAYRAWAPFRALDGRVARLIGYEGARRNYQRLQELPVRLREHADRVGAEADAALAELAAREEAARARDGIQAFVAAREAANERVAEADRRLEQGASEVQAVRDQIERMARGEDPDYVGAVAGLAAELDGVALMALRQQAIATPYPEDDAIVARLLELERERTAGTATLGELREAATRHRARTTDLERVRIDFSRRRYDQPGTGFPDAATVTTLLAQLLNGAMTRDALWRVLEQQRRTTPTRADPTFGSGGFGRGSPWGGGAGPSAPRSQGGFGGTGRAGGGSGSGGGVRTGGGFGGGGAKTGGGIGGGGFSTGGRMGGGGFKTGGKR